MHCKMPSGGKSNHFAIGRNLNRELLRRLNVPCAAEKHKTHSMVLASLTLKRMIV